MTKISYSQAVQQILQGADQPMTIAEILARLEGLRLTPTRNPESAVRNAVYMNSLTTTLGGRPARYAWWPRYLAGSVFRQSLAASDLAAGTFVLVRETWMAMWPDFYAGPSREKGNVILELANGPTVAAQIQQLVPMKAVWGLPPTAALAAWYRQVGALPKDDLIVRVLDVAERRYGVELARRAERDEAAIARRNQTLADLAESVLRTGSETMPEWHLMPRLIVRGAYRHELPPDSWADVLRADLRFVVCRDDSACLADRVVDSQEREWDVPPDPDGSPRPHGKRQRARSAEERQAWGAYLFDRGMNYRWAGYQVADEAYYREALRVDPDHADAWVHLGNCLFDEGWVDEALERYIRAQAAAQKRVIGDPAEYPHPFWLDVDSRPFMRALHGQGICLWRLGQRQEARRVFEWMMTLNPNDNQGVRFLLHDLDEGLSWEESVEREEEEARQRQEAFQQARRKRGN